MSATKKEPPSTHRCPYCDTEHKTPMYAFAHWQEVFTVTCQNDTCGKRYSFYQGHTTTMRQPRREAVQP